jgi:hypothetical protein
MSKTKEYHWQELLHDNNINYKKDILNAEWLEKELYNQDRNDKNKNNE